MNTIREEYEELEKSYGKFLDHLCKIQTIHRDNMNPQERFIVDHQVDIIGSSMKSIRNILDHINK